MDEVNLGQSTDNAVPATSMPVEPTPTERTFRQSEVNDLVKRVKHEAVEDYRRLQTNQPEYAQQKYGNTPPQQNNYSQSLPESDVRRMAAEEAQRLRDQWVSDNQARNEQEYAQKIVKNFYDKIATGKEKYQDFDQVTGNIQYASFPNVVQLLAEHVENSGDVMYELGKDRLKMAQLESLAERSPNDAVAYAKRLADSIRDNEVANKMRTPNAPLSQQRPSNTGTDSGPLSMADLKRKYKS
jgi:hypothetical protein